ncbi:Peptide_methionine sulfoxide reductase MsrA [Hexamita inflata]|uniref:peptide-methionine (S)-S-oxide reductase n=1 Tax=Hexamita inflata TaxID=28002 RepID=A0AA86RCU6_9EUKA|nr:Peptide methionine sulfoxide reductase MsrA [Hexamita inflata]
MKVLYLAGGCFWGVQDTFLKTKGILSTESGYANSAVQNPTYKQVCTGKTGASETVKIEYDEKLIGLTDILKIFFMMIDPTTLNSQGPDYGTQYRSGIYYVEQSEASIIQQFVSQIQKEFTSKIVTEVLPLENYYPAEEYHQKYFQKNKIANTCHMK